MTKKDFQLIAATLAAMTDDTWHLSPDATRDAVVTQIADALATTNPLFKRNLFIQAATGQAPVTARKVRRSDGHICGNPCECGAPKSRPARTLASDLAEDR